MKPILPAFFICRIVLPWTLLFALPACERTDTNDAPMTIASIEHLSNKLKITVVGERAVMPIVYRNFGCGSQSISIDEDFQMFARVVKSTDANKFKTEEAIWPLELTDVTPQFAQHKLTGILPIEKVKPKPGDIIYLRVILPSDNEWTSHFTYMEPGDTYPDDSKTQTDTVVPGTDTDDTDDSATADITRPTDSGTATESETASDPDTGATVFKHTGFAGVTGTGTPFEIITADTGNGHDISNAMQLQGLIEGESAVPMTLNIIGTLLPNIDRIEVLNRQNLYIVGISDDENPPVLAGIGFDINGSSNIVIRNLAIRKVASGTGDAISISGSDHIWIDHCELSNVRDDSNPGSDGLLDITGGSDYITVSWNYFHDNFKGLIAGASDEAVAGNDGLLHITWHHNWFDNVFRTALIMRYGHGHVFNNLFEYTALNGADAIGVSSADDACIRAELNAFHGYATPLTLYDSSVSPQATGFIEEIQNDFGDVAVDDIPDARVCDGDVPYPYSHVLESTDTLRSTIEAHAGVGVIDL
ncbi:MAG: hypothetical protein JXR76_01340 [Deltaproteobacteria bacterium]|nr:hypothetical protein [Deltaproteobacteria bacterium]